VFAAVVRMNDHVFACFVLWLICCKNIPTKSRGVLIMENKKDLHDKISKIYSKLFWPVIWSCVAVIVICGAIVWNLTH